MGKSNQAEKSRSRSGPKWFHFPKPVLVPENKRCEPLVAGNPHNIRHADGVRVEDAYSPA